MPEKELQKYTENIKLLKVENIYKTYAIINEQTICSAIQFVKTWIQRQNVNDKNNSMGITSYKVEALHGNYNTKRKDFVRWN